MTPPAGLSLTAGRLGAWDNQSGNWLALLKSGVQQRFDSTGRLIWEQGPAPGASSRRSNRAAYNPALDVSDTAGTRGGGEQKAWDYLDSRAEVAGGLAAPGSGDDGGVPVQQESVGGAGALKEKVMRAQWMQQPGAHQNDPDGAMETGEVVDPLKKLQDTMEQAAAMASGVADTINQADELQDDIKNFGNGGGSGQAGGGMEGDVLPPAQGVAAAPAAGAAMAPPVTGGIIPSPPMGAGANTIDDQIPPQYGRPPSGAINGQPLGPGMTGAQPTGRSVPTPYPGAAGSTSQQGQTE